MAKAEIQSENLEFLDKKSVDFSVGIKASMVGEKNFLTRHCDGIRHSWLVEPKFVVTETFHKLPKLQDWGLLSKQDNM